MNASCALQHFCDLHGPQILLCTEGRTFIHDINDNENDDLKIFYSQYVKSENPQGKIECRVTKICFFFNNFLFFFKSCTLSSDNTIVSTVDFSKNMLYTSSSSTPNQDLFKDIRNACVRSLNIEVRINKKIKFEGNSIR